MTCGDVMFCYEVRGATTGAETGSRDEYFKKMFVSVMNMLLICLFASMKLEKGHKKNYLALVLKLSYRCDILQNGLKYYRERWVK